MRMVILGRLVREPALDRSRGFFRARCEDVRRAGLLPSGML
jgi:hypothetical protein